jgi:hypothetical protein
MVRSDRRRRSRSRFAPTSLLVAIFIPTGSDIGDEKDLRGASTARGGRVPPGSNGASPYQGRP